MQEMMDFCLWFLAELPAFLMSEPICYLIGFWFSFFVIDLLRSLFHVSR